MNTDMKLQKVPVEKLKPAKYNPRKDLKPGDPAYEKIKRSMTTYGYVDPVDVFDNLGFSRLDFDLARVIAVVSDGVVDGELIQALLHTVADALLDCDAFLLALKFCQCRKD